MDSEEESLPKRRRFGGQRQRLHRAAAQEVNKDQPANHSALATALQELFCIGTLSGQEVQHLASQAALDLERAKPSSTPKPLETLQKLGPEGVHSNNVHRDMMKLLSAQCFVPEAKLCQIPFTKDGAKHFQSVLLPHEIFAWLFEKHNDRWQQMFMPGGQKQVDTFWKQCKLHPSMAGNQAVLSRNLRKSLPVALHGDGVPTVGIGKCWGKLMECYNWHGCLATGGTRACHMLIWTAYQKFFKPGDGGTLDAVFKIIAWSFKTLFYGVWPAADWNNAMYPPDSILGQKAGLPLASGYCGVLTALEGKAAQVKGLVLPLAHVWEIHYNPHCATHRKIRAMLLANCTMEELMAKNKHELSFSRADALELKNNCYIMSHLMWDLSQHFASEDEVRLPNMFICTSKLHMLIHICEYAHAISPRVVWCYSAENYMGITRKICRNCSKGTPPLQAGQKLLEHWRMSFALDLADGKKHLFVLKYDSCCSA
ncbi:unnamed protein product [Durusdinium trenchii]|uniref:Uncharacterized protein n=1 Tax=Durusdinium trenchii TaxID=1381693 RepID=A0ABP0R6R3_9DINO